MKRIIFLILGLSAFGVSLLFITHSTIASNYLTPRKPIYTLKIPSNPTTGYSWNLTAYDSNLLLLKEHHYVAPNTKLVGAGGVEIWQFEATPQAFQMAPVTTTINLSYSRPWEKGQTPAQTKSITISIRR